MKPTLLLFDVDGTLVNSEAIILAAQAEAFAAYGLSMPARERALSIVGLSLHEAFTVLAGPGGPVGGLAKTYGEAFGRLRDSGAIAEPLFAGAQEILHRAAGVEAFRLGIATGKSRRGVSRLVEKHGWQGRFHSVQTADDAPSKPHPAMIRQACAETGVAPERTIMIGDSSYDMAMARAAGTMAIGVAWGFQPRAALIEAGAGAIAEDFDHLDALIAQMSR